MLLGEFNHSIDEKGRLIIPAKLRDDLGDSFVICNGLEGCLFVYSQEEWNKFVAELETLPRMNKDARIFKRYFFGSASEGSFDKQGRVLVPPSLRKAAHLEKDVVLVGVQDRVEIWDKALWEERSQVSEEDLEQYPHLRFASGEDDTGVIISFNSEAESVTDSLMIPAGTHTLAINPLNWKTDSTPAGKEENLGACFIDYSGNIITEIPQLTGAYIDPQCGALKVPDVTPEEYPPVLSIFSDGIYHLYDYQFFYRNLQENVEVRLNAYLEDQAA